ncbi:hypothetical protein [Psychroserpens damuponensis]|nr:hypothetical protein [Psychroserpens damuponensis]
MILQSISLKSSYNLFKDKLKLKIFFGNLIIYSFLAIAWSVRISEVKEQR